MIYDARISDDAEYYIHLFNGNTWHGKLINGEWYIHHDSEPAIIQGNLVWFFYNGINMSINDMPIDDEAKVILTLKYQEETHHNFGGYASYSS